jgi:hypothetical protein
MEMTSVIEPLVLDLVSWVAEEPQPHVEVMEAWRTSCPRLTVWEEAVDMGLIERKQIESRGLFVVVTERGREWLIARAQSSAASCL